MTAEATSASTLSRRTGADAVLNGAAAFWLLLALIGQWAFSYYIAAFYGASALLGNLEAWNRIALLRHAPYVAGDTMGNLAFAAHIQKWKENGTPSSFVFYSHQHGSRRVALWGGGIVLS